LYGIPEFFSLREVVLVLTECLLGKTCSPALRDPADIPQGLGEATGEIVQLTVGHTPLGQKFRRMTEEITSHAELDAFGLVGKTGDVSRAVPDDVAGFALRTWPGQQA